MHVLVNQPNQQAYNGVPMTQPAMTQPAIAQPTIAPQQSQM